MTSKHTLVKSLRLELGYCRCLYSPNHREEKFSETGMQPVRYLCEDRGRNEFVQRVSARDCPKRMCWLVFRYSSTHEKALPNGPLRCRVGVHRASPAYSKSCRTRSRT